MVRAQRLMAVVMEVTPDGPSGFCCDQEVVADIGGAVETPNLSSVVILSNTLRFGAAEGSGS